MTVSAGTAWTSPSPYHQSGPARTFSGVFAAAGTRIALLAFGWLVLNRTNSPVDTAIAVAGLAVPYVLVRLVSAGWIAQIGPRRISASADLASTVTFVGIAVLYGHRTLILIALAVVAGALRGLADESRAVLAAAEDDEEEQAHRDIHPAVLLVGGVACGAVVAWLGVISVVWLAALSFALCAAITVWQAPRMDEPMLVPGSAQNGPPTLIGDLVTQEIRIFRPSVRSRVSFNGALSAAAVDFAAQAGALALVLLWVRFVLRQPDTLGLVGGAFVVGAFAGCAGSTMRQRAALGYLAVAAGFAAGVVPGVLHLHFPVLIWPLAGISFLAGSAMPTGFAARGVQVDYAGTPQERVVGESGAAAVAYLAIPIGILLGATVVTRLNSLVGVAVGGALYLVAVAIPMLSRPPLPSDVVADEQIGHPQVRYAGAATWIAVTLAYGDGEWTVDVSRKDGVAGDPHVVKGSDALHAMEILDVPGVREEIERAISDDRGRAEKEAQRLRDELGDLSVKLSAINEMVELSDLWKSAS